MLALGMQSSSGGLSGCAPIVQRERPVVEIARSGIERREILSFFFFFASIVATRDSALELEQAGMKRGSSRETQKRKRKVRIEG